jgi:hypothetical protein
MIFRFFIEDGPGGVYNEGASEAMDWDEVRSQSIQNRNSYFVGSMACIPVNI